MIVRREDLILTREERDRFERDHAVATAAGKPAATDVWHSDDFGRVRVANEWHDFGPKQAAVFRLLKAASDTENPWLDGKRLLEEADAATMRLIDLFKRKAIWRQLVIADGKGRYRLNIEFLAPERRTYSLLSQVQIKLDVASRAIACEGGSYTRPPLSHPSSPSVPPLSHPLSHLLSRRHPTPR